MLFRYLSLLSILISLPIPALADANSTCYYPNGVAYHGKPCNPDADVSVCCGPTFVCLSNGLCQVGPDARQTRAYKFYRSGCTDPTFNSSTCPQICTGSGFNLESGHGLQSCGNDQYCCAENYDCCTNSTNIFALGVADIVTTIPAMSASTGSSKSVSHSGSSKSTAIGVGVGVGVGGLLVICIAVLLLLRRRRAQRATTTSTETAELDSAGLTKHVQPQDTKAGYSAESSTSGVRHELADEEGNGHGPHEMDGQNPVELDGSEPGPEPRDGGFRPYDGHDDYDSRPPR